MTAADSDHARATKTMAAAALALVTCVAVHAPASAQDNSAREAAVASADTGRLMIHIVPPDRGYGEPFSGKVEIQTLLVHPLIRAVEFVLDGNPVKRVKKPPYQAPIELANPPREQMLEVRACDALGNVLGTDRMTLNQLDVPFGVRITTMRRVDADGYDALRIEADVSVPRSAKLERGAFYRGELLVETMNNFGEDAAPGVPRTIPVESLMEYNPADDFVRVTATLAGGRELEDAQLLQGAVYQDEIDIQLAQLQLLVSDRDGDPVSGLKPEDFEIREGGRKRLVENLHTAHYVPWFSVWRSICQTACCPSGIRRGTCPPAFLTLHFHQTIGPSWSTSPAQFAWPNG